VIKFARVSVISFAFSTACDIEGKISYLLMNDEALDQRKRIPRENMRPWQRKAKRW
jgi:hypothetical protein